MYCHLSQAQLLLPSSLQLIKVAGQFFFRMGLVEFSALFPPNKLNHHLKTASYIYFYY